MKAAATARSGAPKILIDPSSHHLLNAGDVAMSQICVERLRAAWPNARIEALTTAPELLGQYCPGVAPLPAAGRYALTAHGGPSLPPSRRLARAALRHAGRWLARREPAVKVFVDALLDADLLLLSGRGGLTDAFPEETEAMLTEIDIARRIGLPTALVGQGVGPLDDRRARHRMSRVLSHVAFISLREGRAGPDLLSATGLPTERVAVTGDDAIELAFRERPTAAGDAIGLNVRVADYAGVAGAEAARVGSLVGAAARERDAEVVAVGISSHPHEDEAAAPAGAGGAPSAVAEPAEAIAAAGRCRMLVAGSYHAAVFALAQGVPVVGLAASPYYVDKLLGLHEWFGDGCRVVRIDAGANSDELRRIATEIDRQWERAPALRGELLDAAERQIALSRAAHERVAAVIATRAA